MSPAVEEAAVARTPRQRARRDSILASAQLLLHERPYEQIQIRDVAEDAGVAIGTLYRYFPSKELLYAHALLAWSATFEKRVRVGNNGTVDDADRLRALLRAAVRAYERAPNFFRLLTLLEVTPDPAVREVFARFSEGFTGALSDALVETDERDAASIAFVAAAALGTALRGWSLREQSIRTTYERIDATVELIYGEPGSRSAHP